MPFPDTTRDAIHLEALELLAHVGVPAEERVQAQRLTVSLTLWPRSGFGALEDRIEAAVDYAAVADAVRGFVAERRDKLIETLAEAIAAHLLAAFPIARIRVELRKFILPDVQHVAVIITREG
ncbi:MAG: dihydroneopterin aldolase [Chthoniobacterales bacterium]